MKFHHLILAAMMCVPATLGAFTPELPLHRDIQRTSVGAVTQKQSEFALYPTRRGAMRHDFGQSPFSRSLNGTWDFVFFQNDYDLYGNVQRWDTIKVPGNWELQGYDFPVYVNTIYDFATTNPKPPVLPDAIPTGIYRRTFRVPAEWAGNNVYLNVCGAKGGMYVYVNDRFVSYTEDAKDRARINITSALVEGDNELRIAITKWSTGSYLECMDFWRISGIERDVYLSCEPAELENMDINVVSTLGEDLTSGRLKVEIKGVEVPVYCQLVDAHGIVVARGETVDGCFEKQLRKVNAWSAETPYLYKLLVNACGLWTRFDVGFRRFEIVGNTFLVNGKPVKFKGVNLHEHDQYTGHYITRETVLNDLRLMRQYNINAIRTCHYPQPRFFYDLCDSLGFYVYSEANVESHGMGYALDRTLGNRPEWYPKHIDRILNMYYRVRNYPCVTVLSLGNEGGNGCNFYDAYKELKALEKDGMNRPVCYERAEFEWNTDCIVPQYPGAEWFRRMGEEGSDRPVFPSEYAHAMGNSTGSLDLQWSYIYKYPNLQGGFIWDWVDQGLAATDSLGRTYWNYGGDYGDNLPSDNNFLCNGIVGPDREAHPGALEVKHVYQEVQISATDDPRVYRIFNRHYFKSLRGLKLKFEIVADGKVIRRGFRFLHTPAQGESTIKVKLPGRRKLAGRDCYINFYVATRHKSVLVPRNHIVASEQIPLPVIEAKSGAANVVTPGACEVSVVEQKAAIVMSGSGLTAVFDKADGTLRSVCAGGKTLFDEAFGMRPLWWRAPNDNDYGNGWPARTQIFKQATKHPLCTLTALTDCVEAVYSFPTGNTQTVRYTIDGGSLKVDVHFEGVKNADRAVEVPRIGFVLREGIGESAALASDSFSYYGRGPQENYWDRFTSAFVGRYESSASAEFVPYVRPQECGHHTDCKWMEIGPLKVSSDRFEFSALRQSVDDLDSEESVANPYQWRNLTPGEVHDEAAARNHMRRQQHLSDIVDRPFVEVCIDYRQSGIGGYDSWGATAETERTLWSDRSYDWSFWLSALQ